MERDPRLDIPLERIIVAWGEKCKGPGWSNTPFFFIWRDTNGTLKQECIQPEDFTPDMVTIFRVSAAASEETLVCVKNWCYLRAEKSKVQRVIEGDPQV